MFKSIFLLSTNRLAVIGVIFLTDIALARVFGPNGKGVYNYFVATVITAGTFLSFGLNYAYLNLTRSRKEYELYAFRFLSFLILAISSIPLFLAVWPGYAQLDVGMSGLSSFMWGFAIFSETLVAYILIILLRHHGPVWYSSARLLRRTALFLSVSILPFIVGHRLGLRYSLLTVVFSAFSLYVIAGFLCYKALHRENPQRPSMNQIAHHIRYGFTVYLTKLADRFLYRAGLIILGLFEGPASVGVFAVTMGMADILLVLSNSTGLSILADRAKVDLSEEGSSHIIQVFRVSLIIGVLASMAIAATGYFVITLLFGAPFLGAYGPLLVLLPTIPLHSLYVMISNTLQATGQGSTAIRIGAIGCTTNIALALLLVHSYGIYGVASATAIAFILTGVLSVSFLRLKGILRLRDLLIPTAADYTLLRSVTQDLIGKKSSS